MSFECYFHVIQQQLAMLVGMKMKNINASCSYFVVHFPKFLCNFKIKVSRFHIAFKKRFLNKIRTLQNGLYLKIVFENARLQR